MEARPRPPLRLSVEERVDYAVKDAVRKALAKQRRTQEKELDNLSDALQKSLAALAGERDRALRSLAAEEDKRHDLIEDLSAALGDDLSCANLSRLVVGLEKIEQEQKRSVDEKGEEEEPYGRSWVLEQLRQCMYARAAAQDHLRSASDDVAANIFEAEELMDFDPAFSGQHSFGYTSPVCSSPPDTGDSAAGSADTLGVSRARFAASEALRTSVRIARERLEYLERLVRDVETGGNSRHLAASGTVTAKEYKMPSPVSAVDVDGSRDDEEGAHGHDEKRDGSETMGLDASEGGSSVDGITLLSNPVGETKGPRQTESPRGEGAEERDAPHCLESGGGGETKAIATLSRGGHGISRANRNSGNASGRGNISTTRARTGPNGLGGSSESSAEAKRWKMAAHHAEASLADLRKTVGSVVSLSFRCGEERSRREMREDRTVNNDDDDDGDGAVEIASSEMHSENSAALGESKSGGGGDGGLGPCCGRNRCSSCAIRAKAVGALLERLDVLFAAQGEDIVQMASSLDVVRRHHRADPNAPLDAPSRDGEEWTISRDDVGREDPEDADNDSNTRLADGRIGSECDGDSAYKGTEERDMRGSAASLSSNSSTGFQSERSVRGYQEAGRGGKSGGGAAGGSLRDAAPKRDVRTEWEELEGLETHLARYQGGGGLGSPTVQGILDRWIDVSKRRILEGWLAHVLHGGPVNAANGCFVPRVQISSLSKEVRDGLVTAVLPLLLGRRGVLLQVLTRERVELVHDIQIRVTPVAGRRDAPFHAKAASAGRRRAPMGEREHGARIRDMVMKAAHAGYVEEDEAGGDGRAWRTPLASVDSLSRQLKDTWENFNANFGVKGEPWRGADDGAGRRPVFPEY